MNLGEHRVLSGNEAIALAACDAGVALATGYPGTPSTEILERLNALGGPAQWSPNEKVALEVGIGAAYGGARALVTMKHVGLNVAADPLFTVAYTGVQGGLVIVSADDPGMHSSQNEQDNRRYAVAAGIPMLEPSDSQECYDYLRRAFQISERWCLPVLYRVTTRVCHSKSIVRGTPSGAPSIGYKRDIPSRVMIPGYARPAHVRLRQRLGALAASPEVAALIQIVPPQAENETSPWETGIITSGVGFEHSREAAPHAAILKLGLTHPLPLQIIRDFRNRVARCVIIEEGDPCLYEAISAAGIDVEDKPAPFRFGELTVDRVQCILDKNTAPEPPASPGVPPRLCPSCPHRTVFSLLSSLGCIVAGDIGCYTLGVMPPFEAMDTCVCMGASIGVGLGLRHVLPEEQAARVVSVIGDSTFVHSGLTGLVEMAYNPPPTGHIVLILDNGTTAMTGLQEHPGTGKRLDGSFGAMLSFETVVKALGIPNVETIDPIADPERLEKAVTHALNQRSLAVIIARHPCVLNERKQDKAQGNCAAVSTGAAHVSN